MKKNSDAKMILLATGMVGVFSLSSNALAYADSINVKSLIPLERLEPLQRGQIRGRISMFIKQNPNLNVEQIIFAVDKNGEVYVLDKNQNSDVILDLLAQPSCIE